VKPFQPTNYVTHRFGVNCSTFSSLFV